MNQLIDKNLIPTREAAELSGYNSDYLTRMCRVGKIEGAQFGRTWLVSRTSLEAFVKNQKSRKDEIREQLSKTREIEYKNARQSNIDDAIESSEILSGVNAILSSAAIAASATPIKRATLSPFIKTSPKVEASMAQLLSVLSSTTFRSRGVATLATLLILLGGVSTIQLSEKYDVPSKIVTTASEAHVGFAIIASNILPGKNTSAHDANLAVTDSATHVSGGTDVADATTATPSLTLNTVPENGGDDSDVISASTTAEKVLASATSPLTAEAATSTSASSKDSSLVASAASAQSSAVKNTSTRTSVNTPANIALLPFTMIADAYNAYASFTHSMLNAYDDGVVAWAVQSPRIAQSTVEGTMNAGSALAYATMSVPSSVTQGYATSIDTAGAASYSGYKVATAPLSSATKAIAYLGSHSATTAKSLQTQGSAAAAQAGTEAKSLAATQVAAVVQPLSARLLGERVALFTYNSLSGLVNGTVSGIATLLTGRVSNIAVVPTFSIPASIVSTTNTSGIAYVPSTDAAYSTDTPANTSGSNHTSSNSTPIYIYQQPIIQSVGASQDYVNDRLGQLQDSMIEQIEIAVRGAGGIAEIPTTFTNITINSSGINGGVIAGSSFTNGNISSSTISSSTVDSSVISSSTLFAINSLQVLGPTSLDFLTAATSTFTGPVTINKDLTVLGTINGGSFSATSSNFVNSTSTNATSTNFYATNGVIDNLLSLVGNFTDLFTTNAHIANLTATSSAFVNTLTQNATTTNATTTNESVTNATIANASTTNFYAVNGTLDRAVIANLTSGNASSTNLYSTNGTFDSLLAANANFTTSSLGNATAQTLSFTNATGTSLALNTLTTGAANVTGDLAVGGNATTSGSQYIGGAATVNGLATVGSLSVGNLNGFLKATAGAISTSLINLASDVSGVLPVLNGGTGTSSFATNGVVYGNGTNGLLSTSQGPANTVLTGTGGAPAFSGAVTLGTSLTTPTVNATAALLLNGANINTGGTLSNVAYLDQPNAFTGANTFSQLQAFNGGFSATNGSFGTASATTISTTNLFATSSTFTNTLATSASTTNLYAVTSQLDTLRSNSTTISNLVATNATSTNLYATNAALTALTTNSLSVGGNTFTSLLGTGLVNNAGALTVTLAPFSTSNLAEGTNLYYTNTRARSAIAVDGSTPLTYNAGTGVIGITPASTSQNGYLTSASYNTFNNKQNALAFGNITSSSTNITITGGNGAVIGSGVSINFSTSTFSGSGSGLNADYLDGLDSTYFLANSFSTTSANAYLATKTTDALTEGTTNLYFTNARARAALSASAPLTYNATTGNFAIIQASTSTNGYLSSLDFTTFNNKISSTSLSASGPLAYNPASGLFTLGVVDQTHGGTGFSSYTPGDVLYADNTGTLQKLPAGSTGQVLKIQAGLPSWGADQTIGAGGSDGIFATSTGKIYPLDTSQTVIVGSNATATANSIFEVNGQQYISSKLGIGTTSPTAALSVGGAGLFSGGVTAGNFINTGVAGNSLTYLNSAHQESAVTIGTGLSFTAGTLANTGVITFNGRAGAVVPANGDYTTTQVTEGTNLYYTDARARSALSANAPLTYNSSTGAFGITQASTSTNGYLSSADFTTFAAKQNALTFGNLTSGSSNLTVTGGTGAVIGSGVTITLATSTFSGSGSGLNADYLDGYDSTYFFANSFSTTSANAYLATKTTDNLTEGTTNLYFSNARARAALSSTATGLSYNAGTGVFSLTAGYNIPTTASTTDWNTAYVNRITAANAPLSIANNTISIAQASRTTSGYLSAADFTTFDNKVSSTSLSATGPLAYNSATGVFSIAQATSVTNGYLSSTDFNTFSNKQNALTFGNLTSSSTNITVTGGTGAVIGNGVSISLATSTFSGTGSGFNADLLDGLDSTYFLANSFSTTSANAYLATKSTTNLAEGTNLYYTAARFAAALAGTTTDALTEGTNNLYFTNARARGALSASAPLTYNATTGNFAINQASSLSDGYLSAADYNTFNNKQATIVAGTGLSFAGNTLNSVFTQSGNNIYNNNTGNVGIGTTTPGYALTVAGNISSPGAGTGSEKFGAGAVAPGLNALALGNGAQALGDQSTAVGYGATATGTAAASFGWTANASGIYSTSIGAYSISNGYQSTALGNSAYSTGDYSTAIGFQTIAAGYQGVAIGDYANASLYQSTAIGYLARSLGSYGVAIGDGSTAGTSSIAIGSGISAAGANQLNIGNTIYGNTASGNVGIGSTSPFARLSVAGVGTGTGINFQTTNSSNAPLFSIRDNGTVGIGTTTPLSALAVSGGQTIGADYNIAAPTNGLLVEGNVGIGTKAPVTALEVANAGHIRGSYTPGTTQYVDIYTNSGSQSIIESGAGSYGLDFKTLYAPGVIRFFTGSSSTTPAVTINAAGLTTVNNLADAGLTANTLVYANGTKQLASGSVTAPLTFTAGALAINQASGVSDGYLSATDYNTFNNKQAAITAGTGLSFSGNTLNSVFTQSGNNIYNNNSGYVGIGTTNPSYQLDVNSAGVPVRINSTNNIYSVALSNAGTLGGYIGTNGTNLYLIGNSGATANAVTITPTGFVNVSQYSGYQQAGVTVLYASSTGDTAVGRNAGQAFTTNTAIIESTAIGSGALNSVSLAASYNTAIGASSMQNNTTGQFNTAVGRTSLTSNLTGSQNAALGLGALTNNATSTNNTAVGYYAGYGVAGVTGSSNNVFLGNSAGFGNTTGNNNFYGGYQSGYYASSTSGNVGIGYTALRGGSVDSSGVNNTAVGGSALTANASGSSNNAFGSNALAQNTTGTGNSALSYFALAGNKTGNNNTAVGNIALQFNVTGNNNTAFGYAALTNNLSATTSVAIGAYAGYGFGGAYSNQGSTIIGNQAGLYLSTGSDYNTLVGYNSGYGVTTGARNVLIGQSTIAASYNQVTTGSNNIAIGNDVAVASSTANNQLNIGNLIYGTGLNGTGAAISTGNVGIGTTSPSNRLEVAGNIGLGFGSSAYLTSNRTANILVGEDSSATYIAAGVNSTSIPANLFIGRMNTNTIFQTNGGIERLRIASGGNVGIGTSTPTQLLSVAGGLELTGGLFDQNYTAGTNGQLLQTTGSGIQWVSTSTLGFAAAGSGVLSFNGRTGAVVPVSGDYTTTLVPEGTNLYYTDARSRAALSVTGPLTYNSTTGAFAINQSSSISDGYLSATDFNTFNNKQAAITAGTGLSFSGNTLNSVFTQSGNNIYNNNTGNVGIGTSSPRAKEEITGDLIVANGTNLNIYNPEFGVGVNNVVGGSYQTVINGIINGTNGGTGQVVIGDTVTANTSGSNFNTAVGTGGGVYNSANSQAFGRLASVSSSTNSTAIGYNASVSSINNAIALGDANAKVLVAGSVGIGTTSTPYALSVQGTEGVTGLFTANAGGVLAQSVAGIKVVGSAADNNWAGGIDFSSYNGTSILNRIINSSLGMQFTTGTSGSSVERLRITQTGNIGIGTTTPSQLLSVQGNGLFSGDLFAANLTATGTATVGNIVDNGVTANTLVYANGAKQISSVTVNGPLTFTAGTLAINQASSISDGYLSSTDYNTFNNKQAAITAGTGLSFAGNTLNSVFTQSGNNIYNNNTGNVGIGNTSPAYKLDVGGFVNVDQYSGYKQAGNTILYASSTNYSTLLGINAGRAAQTNAAILANTAIGNSALSSASLTGNWNTATGYQALLSNTTGTENAAFGDAALLSNTIGYDNNAFGESALRSNTTGAGNVALGSYALRFNGSASTTVAIGYQAGYGVSGVTASQNNVFLGTQAGYSNTTGNNNFLGGYQAGYQLTSASNNVFIGGGAGLYATSTSNGDVGIGNVALGGSAYSGYSGYYNTGVGSQALTKDSLGIGNAAFGYNSLAANTTGNFNSSFGYAALQANTTGTYNTAIGQGANYQSTVGNNNASFGYQAMYNNFVGSNNTAIGTGALTSSATSSNNTALGYAAGAGVYNVTNSSNNVFLGAQAGQGNTTGNNNFFGGYQSGYYASSTSNNVAIGYQALRGQSYDSSGVNNVAIGYQALVSNSSGSYNSAVGYGALYSNGSGTSNTALGYYSLLNNSTGSQNVAIGFNALSGNSTGASNVALGYNVLLANTAGTSNVALGQTTLSYNTTGSNNVALGQQALGYNSSATSSVAVGYQAGRGNATYNNQGSTEVGYQAGYNFLTGSDYNTLLGNLSGYGVTTGAQNVLIGASTISASWNQVTTGSRNIAIGTDVAVASPTASNQLNIGNLIYGTGLDGTGSTISSGNVGIGTNNPGSPLEVSRTYTTGTTPTNLVSANYTINNYASLPIGYHTAVNGNLTLSGAQTYSLYSSAGVKGVTTLNSGATYNYTNSHVLSGVYGGLVVNNGSTADRVSVVQAQAQVLNSSSIGNLFSIYAESPILSGGTNTVTNGYGLYINSQKVAGVTNAYGVYAAGSNDINYFAGNVGIGTTSPSKTLSVQGNELVSGTVTWSALPNALISTDPSGTVVATTIGNGLTFSGNTLSVATSSLSSGFFVQNGNSFGTLATLGTNDLNPLAFETNNVERARFDTAGNFGIGTTTPNANLVVSNTGGSSAASLAIQSAGNSVASGNVRLQLMNGDGNSYQFQYGGSSNTLLKLQYNGGTQAAFNSNGSLALGTNVGAVNILDVNGSAAIGYAGTAAPTNGLIVAGNTGIGTAAPAYKLDVAGFANVDQYSGYKQAGNTILYASSTNNGVSVGINAGRVFQTNATPLYGTAVGTNALQSLSLTGLYNTAVGTAALQLNTSGASNVGIGSSALLYNTTGSNSVGIGVSALQNNGAATNTVAVGFQAGVGVVGQTASQNNVFLGYQSAYANTTGSNNFFGGYQAGLSNTTANNGVFTGYQAGYTSTSTPNDVGIGYRALANDASPYGGTVGIGFNALAANTYGYYNTAVGGSALQANTTGSTNTGIGYLALAANTTGSNNTALGYAALNVNNGTGNSAFGQGALQGNTTGNANVAIGNAAGLFNGSATSSVIIGSNAGRGISGQTASGYNIFIGDSAGYGNTTGSNNFYGGYHAGNYASSTSNNVGIGYFALNGNVNDSSGANNTAVGYSALATDSSGSNNAGFGWGALQSNTSGAQNNAFGYNALGTNTTGGGNVAVGYQALVNNTSGSNNNAVGLNALLTNTTGANNVAMGNSALRYNTSATSSVAIGYSAAIGTGNYSNQGGTVVGYQAGVSFQTGSDYNSLFGFNAGLGITTGARNTVIGQSTITASNNQITTGSNNIAIGNDVAVASPTANNQLVIGNLIYGTGLNGTGTTLSTGNIGIGTTTPQSKLSVDGTISSGGSTLGTYQLLNTSGAVRGALQYTGAVLDLGSTAGIDETFSPGAAERVRITSTGNVGIGTTTPAQKLSVAGDTYITNGLGVGTASAGVQGRIDLAGTAGGSVINAATTDSLAIQALGGGKGITLQADNIYLKLSSGGAANVYAGNTQILDTSRNLININSLTTGNITDTGIAANNLVYSNGSQQLAALTLGNGLTLTSGTLNVSTSTLAGNFFQQNGNSFGTTAMLGTNDNYPLQLETNGIERARIDTAGNLGIGTTSPFARLSLNGANGGTTPLFSIASSTSGGVAYTALQIDQSGNAFLGLNGANVTIGSSTAYGVPLAVNDFGNSTAQTGAELVTDGSFATGTNWTFGSGWALGAGQATHTSSGGAISTIAINNGGTGYVTGDTITVSGGSGDATYTVTAPSGIVTALTPVSAGTSYVTTTNAVTTGGTGTGLTVAITQIADAATLSQSIAATTAGSYQVTFTITGYSGLGKVKVSLGNSSAYYGGNGSYTVVLTQGSTLTFTPTADFAGGITGVSAKMLSGTNAVARINNNGGTAALEFRSGGVGLANSFIGLNAGKLNTTGANNTVLGYNSLISNTVGNYNVALGSNILAANTTGSSNVGIGATLLQANTTGYYNVSIGIGGLNSNTTGTNNVALGYYGLYRNTTGGSNFAAGQQALYNNTTGTGNIAFGGNALINNTIGSYNFATAGALSANTTGNYNVAMGVGVLTNNKSGSTNFGVGVSALGNNIIGSNNIAIGDSALLTSTSTSNAIALGTLALAAQTSGISNIAIGQSSARFTTTGSNNSVFGVTSFFSNTTGGNNTAIGSLASYYNASATSTVALGYQAAKGTGSYSNQGGTVVGTNAGYNFQTGSDYNTILGYQTGYGITTGARNVLIGQSTIAASLNQITTGSNNIAIGNDVAVASSTANNQLTIGNLIYGTGLSGTGATVSTGNIGIGTTTPAIRLDVYQSSAAIAGIFQGSGNAAVGIGSITGAGLIQSYTNDSATAVSNLALQTVGGNVGIGTTTPDGKLTVSANSLPGVTASVNANLGVFRDGGSSNGLSILTPDVSTGTIFFGSPSSNRGSEITWNYSGNFMNLGTHTPGGQLTFMSGNAVEAVRISSTGNVGIGTTTPSSKLDVNDGGVSTVQRALTIEGALSAVNAGHSIDFLGSLSQAAGNTAYARIAGVTDNLGVGGVLSFYTASSLGSAATERMRIDQNGNVGIGTTTPTVPLTVYSSSSNYAGVFRGGNGNALGIGSFATGGFITGLTSSDPTTAGTSNLLLNPFGSNVAIGTTSPTFKLDVWDNQTTVSNTLRLVNQNTTAGAVSRINLGAFNGTNGLDLDQSSNATGPAAWATGSYDAFIHTAQAGSNLNFAAGGATAPQLILTAAGNVGIGTTSPTAKLSVETNGATVGLTVMSATGGAVAIGNASGYGRIQGYTSDNIATAGTANLVLEDVGGNVGIGTTTPAQTLSVAGNEYLTTGLGIGTASAGVQGRIDLQGAGGTSLINAATTDIIKIQALGGGKSITEQADNISFFSASGGAAYILNGGTTIMDTSRNLLNINSLTSTGAAFSSFVGSVGIGTTTPVARLGISTTGNAVALDVNNTVGAVWQSFSTGGNQFQYAAFRVQANGFEIANLRPTGNIILTPGGTGGIGIGTTSPNAMLDLVNTNNATAPLLQLSNVVSNATTTQFVVSSAGNVGIKNTTGTYPFQVSSGAGNIATPLAMFGQSDNGRGLQIGAPISSGAVTAYFNTTNGNVGTRGLDFRNEGTSVMYYNSVGVGIGTTTPISALNVSGGVAIGSGIYNAAPTNGLLVQGNVGIGSTTPNYPLVVQGGANSGISGVVTGLALTTPANGTRSSILFDNGPYASGNYSAWVLGHGVVPTGAGISVNGFGLYDADAGRYPFVVDDGARNNALVIRNTNAPGTVGIGTTTPYGNLSVTGLGTGTGVTFLAANSANTPTFAVLDNGNVGIGTTTPTNLLTLASGSATTPALSFGDTGTGIYRSALNNLTFVANSTAVFTITPSQFVLNGTISNSSSIANAAISVPSTGTLINRNVADANTALTVYQQNAGSTGNILALQNSSGVQDVFTQSGALGIGTTTPTAQLTTTGTVRFAGFGAGTLQTDASGNVTVSSDERLKNINGSYTRGLADIMNLSPILYHWNATSGLDQTTQYAGFSAQNVQANIPEAVDVDPRGYLSLQDRPILAASVNAIKQLAGTTNQLSLATSSLSTRLSIIETTVASSTASSAPKNIAALNVNATGTVSAASISTTDVNATGTVTASNFALATNTTNSSTPAEVLTATGSAIDMAKFSSYTFSNFSKVASDTTALTTRVDSIETRVGMLENMQMSTSSLAAAIAGIQSNASSTNSTTSMFSTSTLVSMMSDLGVLVEKGIAQFNTLVVRDLVFSKDSNGASAAGSSTVLAGNTTVEVTNDHMLASSQVSVTMTSPLTGNWYVTDKKDGSFRVTLSGAQGSDVTFDYVIIQTSGQLATSTPIGPSNTGSFSISAWLGSLFGGAASGTPSTGNGSSTGSGNGSGSGTGTSTGGNSDSGAGTGAGTTTPSANGPVVTLNGDAVISVDMNGAFIDPGATAVDSTGTDVSSSIQVTGSVDTATVGMYTVTYTATDASGATGSASRVVTVVDHSVGTAGSGGSGDAGSSTGTGSGSGTTSP